MVLYYKVITTILTIPKLCLIMKCFSLKLLPLGNPKSYHDSNQQEFKIQTYNVPWSDPILNALFIQNHVIILPLLRLHLLYFGFRPRNPCEMTENEMKAFYYFLSICLHNSLCSFHLLGNQWFCTHFASTALTSFSTNLIYGCTSRSCILDTSSSIVGIVSTCFCAWIICGSFFS